MFRCASYCLGESLDLLALSEYLRTSEYSHRVHNSDVIHIDFVPTIGEMQREIFVFGYGCLVFWNYSKEDENEFVTSIHDFVRNPFSKITFDVCSYSVSNGNKTSIDMKNDVIQISADDEDDPYIKLALAYGLSQSVKLGRLETSIWNMINENKNIPLDLMNRGYIKMSRTKLAKKIGELLVEMSAVNLSSEVRDVPGFFWKHAMYEPFYELARKFMDIEQRSANLNRKIDVIYDLYEILRDEVNHSHSSRLEMIIIVLIFTEIIISFLFRNYH